MLLALLWIFPKFPLECGVDLVACWPSRSTCAFLKGSQSIWLGIYHYSSKWLGSHANKSTRGQGLTLFITHLSATHETVDNHTWLGRNTAASRPATFRNTLWSYLSAIRGWLGTLVLKTGYLVTYSRFNSVDFFPIGNRGWNIPESLRTPPNKPDHGQFFVANYFCLLSWRGGPTGTCGTRFAPCFYHSTGQHQPQKAEEQEVQLITW